jgi:hypothetical protein
MYKYYFIRFTPPQTFEFLFSLNHFHGNLWILILWLDSSVVAISFLGLHHTPTRVPANRLTR